VRRIGRGAYGEVWLGRDIIGSFHAIKLVFRDDLKGSEPFEREFKGLSRFTPISRQHPGLVHVLQVGRNDREGYLYYVMELADDRLNGQNIQPGSYSPRTLSSLLHEKRPLPLAECLDIAIHLADALEFLHRQNLIHRDIKPSNVIFVNGTPKFADVGLVTNVASDESDVTYLGTKGYIAPEGPGTPGADVYSLGKVIYQMGFGLDVDRFPELPTSVIQNPSEDALFQLNRVIMKACESSPVARFQSAGELRAALAVLQQPR
jgi:serine/threonine protein kinase